MSTSSPISSISTCVTVAGLLLSAPVLSLAQNSLIFNMEKSQTAQGGTTPLDEFSDEELISITPGPSLRASKILSIGTLNTLLGDEDADANFYEGDVLDELNALALHPDFTGNDPTLYDYVFSSQNDFGQAWSLSIDDGDIFRLTAPPITFAEIPVQVFLSEFTIQNGLGTTSGLDVDAIAFGSDGTLFLSFKDDELILGDSVPIGDGGIVAFDAGDIVYGPDRNIVSLGSSTVTIVVNESAVDAIVANAGLKDEIGLDVNTIGDLSGLDMDPAGGTFSGQGGAVWPNLFLCGSRTGPRILSTLGGGTIGTLNGTALGDPASPDASRLGLDSIDDDADVASLTVIAEQEPPLVLDFEGSGFSPSDRVDNLHIGNGTPSSPQNLALFGIGSPVAGAHFDALRADLFRFIGLYTFPFIFTTSLGSLDANGRTVLPIVLPPEVVFDLNITIQVFDFSDAELSAPILIAFDAEGA